MYSKKSWLKIWSMVFATIIGLFLYTNTINAQYKLSNSLKDTVYILDLVKKARESLNKSFDSTFFYARKAINLSEQIGYTKGIAYGNHRLCQAFDFSGNSDSALKYGILAQKYFRLINDSIGIARSLFTFGNIYLYKTWYDAALKYFFDSHRIFQNTGDTSGMNDCYVGMGLIYYHTKNWPKSIYYYKLTAEYEQKTNDLEGLPETYGNLGCSYFGFGKTDSAVLYYKLAENISLKTNNNRALTSIYNDLGNIANEKGNFPQALIYLNKALTLKYELKYYECLGENYINLGSVYEKMGDAQNALQYIKKGIEYSKQYQYNEDLVLGYKAVSKLYEKLGDIKKALFYHKLYLQVNDTLNLTKYNQQVAQWQSLYGLKDQEFKLAGAEQKLTAQKLIIQKNKSFQQLLLFLLVTLALLSILIIRNSYHKRLIAKKETELQKHIIRELENEKKLWATQLVLEGEEIERKRLARDLHDGLGGLLSGVKTSLNNMKGSVILSNESVEHFNLAINMLDSSITELRRVAYNMMPEALIRLGLKDTLTDYCTELDKVLPAQIKFQFFGQFQRVDPALEINSYRIIQELVNNAIKHSEAKNIIVQMIQETSRVCYIITDDGKGFDTNTVELKKTVGLTSLKSRVDTFNGQVDIDSQPGRGTEITVEFLL
jgi:signal transduction histidine kinase